MHKGVKYGDFMKNIMNFDSNFRQKNRSEGEPPTLRSHLLCNFVKPNPLIRKWTYRIPYLQR